MNLSTATNDLTIKAPKCKVQLNNIGRVTACKKARVTWCSIKTPFSKASSFPRRFLHPSDACYRSSLIDNGMLCNTTAASFYALHSHLRLHVKRSRPVSQAFFHHTLVPVFFFMLHNPPNDMCNPNVATANSHARKSSFETLTNTQPYLSKHEIHLAKNSFPFTRLVTFFFNPYSKVDNEIASPKIGVLEN